MGSKHYFFSLRFLLIIFINSPPKYLFCIVLPPLFLLLFSLLLQIFVHKLKCQKRALDYMSSTFFSLTSHLSSAHLSSIESYIFSFSSLLFFLLSPCSLLFCFTYHPHFILIILLTSTGFRVFLFIGATEHRIRVFSIQLELRLLFVIRFISFSLTNSIHQ